MDMSVCVHAEKDETLGVGAYYNDAGDVVVMIDTERYPSVTLFLKTAQFIQLRDSLNLFKTRDK